MLKYLIVQLDTTSVSFCHYTNHKTERKLIDIKALKDALLWSMKENLSVQFVYPDYVLPTEYKAVIDTIEHADIVSSTNPDTILRENADVVVFNAANKLNDYNFVAEQAYILRTSLAELFDNYKLIGAVLPSVNRLNVIITDVAAFGREEQLRYKEVLADLVKIVAEEYGKDHSLQTNLLTDRILLDKMNNCNAGDEHITLAPDGKFYICPAFYVDDKDTFTVGSLSEGTAIKNLRLYKLGHAPICRICDAFQCKRCVWLNRKLTLEVNTPSHQQCVMSHLERNASRELLGEIRKKGEFMPAVTIPALNYLDPFDKILEN